MTADHDPGDEHDALERLAVATGANLERLTEKLLGMSRYVEPDADLRARAIAALRPPTSCVR